MNDGTYYSLLILFRYPYMYIGPNIYFPELLGIQFRRIVFWSNIIFFRIKAQLAMVNK